MGGASLNMGVKLKEASDTIVTGRVCPMQPSAMDLDPYLKSPDPWADLESRTPLRVPRNYPILV